MVTSVYLPVVSTFSKDANPCQGLSRAWAEIFHHQKFKALLLIFQNSNYHPQCLISVAGQSKCRTQTLFWVCLFFGFSVWEFEHFKAQDKCCQYLLLSVITLWRNSRGGDCAKGAGGNLTGLNIRKSNRNPHFMHEWHHRVHLSHSLATNIYSAKKINSHWIKRKIQSTVCVYPLSPLLALSLSSSRWRFNNSFL